MGCVFSAPEAPPPPPPPPPPDASFPFAESAGLAWTLALFAVGTTYTSIQFAKTLYITRALRRSKRLSLAKAVEKFESDEQADPERLNGSYVHVAGRIKPATQPLTAPESNAACVLYVSRKLRIMEHLSETTKSKSMAVRMARIPFGIANLLSDNAGSIVTKSAMSVGTAGSSGSKEVKSGGHTLARDVLTESKEVTRMVLDDGSGTLVQLSLPRTGNRYLELSCVLQTFVDADVKRTASSHGLSRAVGYLQEEKVLKVDTPLHVFGCIESAVEDHADLASCEPVTESETNPDEAKGQATTAAGAAVHAQETPFVIGAARTRSMFDLRTHMTLPFIVSDVPLEALLDRLERQARRELGVAIVVGLLSAASVLFAGKHLANRVSMGAQPTAF